MVAFIQMCNCLQVPNTVTGLELDIAKWNTVIETDSWKGDWTPGTRYSKSMIL